MFTDILELVKIIYLSALKLKYGGFLSNIIICMYKNIHIEGGTQNTQAKT